MTIIALAGKKQTGKNTIAKLIATQVAGKTVELAFAYSLKQEVAKACGVTVQYIEEHKDNFRKILQGWGTDFRRNLSNKNYWIDKFDAELWKQDADVVVVTDVRFLNEYAHLNTLDAVMVSVSRPLYDFDDHPSETDLDKIKTWHHIILNTGSIEDLKPQVRELLTLSRIATKNNKL